MYYEKRTNEWDYSNNWVLIDMWQHDHNKNISYNHLD